MASRSRWQHRAQRWDPFLRDHPATQVLPQRSLPGAQRRDRAALCAAAPYQVGKSEFESAAGTKGWNAHQGFLHLPQPPTHFGRRVAVPGMTRDEHLKLARIRIDLGNDVDFD